MKQGRFNCIPALMAVLLLAALLITGCGGSDKKTSGSSDSQWQQASSRSGSYYPVDGVTTGNQVVPLHWTYVATNESTYVDDEGVSYRVKSHDVTFTPESQTLTTVTAWSVSGASSATVVTETSDMLVSLTGGLLYLKEDYRFWDEQGVVSGAYVHTIDTVRYVLQSPYLLLFLSRSDLHALLPGTTDETQGYGTKTWTSSSDVNNNGSAAFQTSYTWEIINTNLTMTLHGRTYKNVVKVTATSLTGQGDDSVETFWVAQGIGLIKWSGPINSYDSDNLLTYELKETNLVQAQSGV